MSAEPVYVRKTMVIRWRSRATGRVHRRTVALGHVREGSDLTDLAVLNVGIHGSVVSFEVLP